MSHIYTDHNGTRYWYNDKEQWHREDGPAVEASNGHNNWYINGKRHREDGPAVEDNRGNKWWYYNDEFIGYSYYGYGFTQEDFERFLKIKEYW